MDDNTANNVAQAIAVSLDWSSTPDARKAALSYLESVSSIVLCCLFNSFLFSGVCVRGN